VRRWQFGQRKNTRSNIVEAKTRFIDRDPKKSISMSQSGHWSRLTICALELNNMAQSPRPTRSYPIRIFGRFTRTRRACLLTRSAKLSNLEIIASVHRAGSFSSVLCNDLCRSDPRSWLGTPDTATRRGSFLSRNRCAGPAAHLDIACGASPRLAVYETKWTAPLW
jgi:hypothetical protein